MEGNNGVFLHFYEMPPRNAELIVVVGGDGSVIDASKLAVQYDIPLIGVNLGKVGYLAELYPCDVEELSRIVTGEFKIEKKMLLEVSKHSKDGTLTCCDRFAVNDVVISHDNYFGISDFRVENEHGDHVHYRADGVIVSTPAGSTAYSLSAGGPVISHALESIMLTPVCPHTFFNRAIVYSPDEHIKISNAGDTVLNISVDGRLFSILQTDEYCVVRKSVKYFKMLTLNESNVFSILSKKIKLLHDSI